MLDMNGAAGVDSKAEAEDSVKLKEEIDICISPEEVEQCAF